MKCVLTILTVGLACLNLSAAQWTNLDCDETGFLPSPDYFSTWEQMRHQEPLVQQAWDTMYKRSLKEKTNCHLMQRTTPRKPRTESFRVALFQDYGSGSQQELQGLVMEYQKQLDLYDTIEVMIQGPYGTEIKRYMVPQRRLVSLEICFTARACDEIIHPSLTKEKPPIGDQ